MLALCAVALALSCIRDETPQGREGTAKPPSDRFELTPAIITNLGITFANAASGRVGVWRKVSGVLEVPESKRWTLRVPGVARIVRTVPRWQRVAAGDEIAALRSPELVRVQRAIEIARRRLARAREDAARAAQRRAESEERLAQARAFETAAAERLAELRALAEGGTEIPASRLIDAQRTVTEAGKAALDAAIVRDDLVTRAATKTLEAEDAKLAAGQRMHELALLTGSEVAALAEGERWRELDVLVIRAPAAGVVVGLFVAQGERVDAGTEIAHLMDASELRFRGQVPEGDLGSLAAGDRVRLEFPSRDIPAVETKLRAPLPVADPKTRMVRVEAVVPNTDGRLAHGMSVLADVLVEESAEERVLVPWRAVVRDGLDAVIFRRDPENGDKVIRTKVTLGLRGGGDVEVLAGVTAGEAVVASGVHQLERTGLGKLPPGGHMHADGTWHEDH